MRSTKKIHETFPYIQQYTNKTGKTQVMMVKEKKPRKTTKKFGRFLGTQLFKRKGMYKIVYEEECVHPLQKFEFDPQFMKTGGWSCVPVNWLYSAGAPIPLHTWYKPRWIAGQIQIEDNGAAICFQVHTAWHGARTRLTRWAGAWIVPRCGPQRPWSSACSFLSADPWTLLPLYI